MFLQKAFKKYTYFYHVHIIHVLAKSEIQMFNSTEIEQLKKKLNQPPTLLKLQFVYN